MNARRLLTLALSVGLYVAAATLQWHPDVAVRRATGIVLATLVLWISEAAPLGVVALGIPIAATFAGLLSWKAALAAWGDPIIFLFLGAFLLARALEKYGAFDWILRGDWARGADGGGAVRLTLLVLAFSGTLSTMQNNTAVAAMLLPVTTAIARRTRSPAIVLLGLAFGATFGGMATPVGTAPNFLGYAEMKKLDASISFISWLRVGIPAWVGTTLIGWGVLALAAKFSRAALVDLDARSRDAQPKSPSFKLDDPGPPREPDLAAARVDERTRRRGRRWALTMFASAALTWLAIGLVIGLSPANSPQIAWIETYLPESLVPVVAALTLFLIPVGPDHRTVLDRDDFQAIDWDTLFLIAGGLCLGRVLKDSGTASALAHAVADLRIPSFGLMLALAGTTVLLSELTSNTATAVLMVPIAGALASALGCPPVNAIWLVALSASLGFALPVSTPPNAIVYGTRLVPLRLMIGVGIAVDILCAVWVVCCIVWLA